MAEKKLSLKEQKFVENYLQHGNATQAARDAGYMGKYVDRQAYAMLNAKNVKELLEKHRAKLNKSSLLTIEYKLNLLYTAITECANIKDYDRFAKLLEVSNRMQGHNAPEKASVTINSDIEPISSLTEQYVRINRPIAH